MRRALLLLPGGCIPAHDRAAAAEDAQPGQGPVSGWGNCAHGAPAAAAAAERRVPRPGRCARARAARAAGCPLSWWGKRPAQWLESALQGLPRGAAGPGALAHAGIQAGMLRRDAYRDRRLSDETLVNIKVGQSLQRGRGQRSALAGLQNEKGTSLKGNAHGGS